MHAQLLRLFVTRSHTVSHERMHVEKHGQGIRITELVNLSMERIPQARVSMQNEIRF